MKILAIMLIMAILCSCSPGPAGNETLGEGENQIVEATPTPEVTKTPTPTPTIEPTKAPVDNSEYGKYSNDGQGWGFRKVENTAPTVPNKTKEMLKKHDAFYMDNSGEKVLFLTFDEGYENGYTAQILDTLKKCNVPAAFFITGSYLKYEPELVRRMVEEGHIVGNHTENHPNLHKLVDADKMKEELKILDDKFYDMFGQRMRYMRPPEGEFSERVLAAAKDEGYKTALWSFAYRDWERDKVNGADYAFSQVTPYLHSGAVILLHAVSSDNANALEDIINYAKSQGYEFKSLDELVL